MLTGETARVLSNAQQVERVAASPSSLNSGGSTVQGEGVRVPFSQQGDSLTLSGVSQSGTSSLSAELESKDTSAASAQAKENTNLLQQVEDRIQNALEDASDESDLSVRFRRDEDTGSTLVQFIEPDTGDVVRQFPPEDVLKFASRFQDLTGDMFSGETQEPGSSGSLLNDQA